MALSHALRHIKHGIDQSPHVGKFHDKLCGCMTMHSVVHLVLNLLEEKSGGGRITVVVDGGSIYHLHAIFLPVNLRNQELSRTVPYLKLLRHRPVPRTFLHSRFPGSQVSLKLLILIFV